MKNQLTVSFLYFFLLYPLSIFSQGLDNAVVQIKAKAGPNETLGAGIILGFESGSENKVYILTTSQVIKDEHETISNEILVYFRKKPSGSFPASVFEERIDENLDLLVLEVRVPPHEWDNIPLYELPVLKSGDKINRKSDVIILGHPEGKEWEVNQLNFVQKTPSAYMDYGKFSVSPISIVAGYAGGPVFDMDGNLLGMLTGVSATETECVSIDAINTKLFTWEVPVNLLKRQKKKLRPDPLLMGILLGSGSIAAGYLLDLSARKKYDYYGDYSTLPSEAYPTTTFKKPFTRNELYTSAVTDRQMAVAASIGGGLLIMGGIILHYSGKNKESIPPSINLKKAKVKISPSLNQISYGTSFGINLRF